MKILIPFTISLLPSLLIAAEINIAEFDETHGFELTSHNDGLALTWDAPEGKAYLDLQFIPRRGNNAALPLIREIGINGTAALSGVDPNYLFWVGDRDLNLRGGWEIFFDFR